MSLVKTEGLEAKKKKHSEFEAYMPLIQIAFKMSLQKIDSV